MAVHAETAPPPEDTQLPPLCSKDIDVDSIGMEEEDSHSSNDNHVMSMKKETLLVKFPYFIYDALLFSCGSSSIARWSCSSSSSKNIDKHFCLKLQIIWRKIQECSIIFCY